MEGGLGGSEGGWRGDRKRMEGGRREYGGRIERGWREDRWKEDGGRMEGGLRKDGGRIEGG